jgi:hypothetical protein
MMSFDLESPENKMNGHVVPVRDLGEDEHVFYDILEYAEKYYNDHPRDVGGRTGGIGRNPDVGLCVSGGIGGGGMVGGGGKVGGLGINSSAVVSN